MMEKEQNILTIKGTPYEIEHSYFVKIMQDLGEYLCKRYHEVDVVSPLELMSQIAYIDDLTIQQKMGLTYWIARRSENNEYEDYILACLDKLEE